MGVQQMWMLNFLLRDDTAEHLNPTYLISVIAIVCTYVATYLLFESEICGIVGIRAQVGRL